jgi:cell division protein ZapE
MTEGLSPLQRYRRDVASGALLADPAQEGVMRQLDDLCSRLLTRAAEQNTVWARARKVMGRPAAPERGLYIWGGVGRGKTHLVDTFYDSLALERKLRVHFHRFMQRVHSALTQHSGAKNPLEVVADEIADEALVLCFDEFFVSDIGDAMILGGLIDALFRRGVTLVATSNIPPQELYRDGLQRSRFLPAIALIEQHLTVTQLEAATDYRFRTLQRADLWHVPHDEVASAALSEYFLSLTGQEAGDPKTVDINQRAVKLLADAPGVAWATFSTLCEEPRSAVDYVEMAREYHTVLIEQIPPVGPGQGGRGAAFY